MTKQYYDHKTVLCEGCAYYHRAARVVNALGEQDVPEGCGLYAYFFHNDYPEPAEDCKGFITPQDYRTIREQQQPKKKKR